MKYKMIQVITIGLALWAFPIFVSAQSLGDLPGNIGGGSTGNGSSSGSGSGSGSGGTGSIGSGNLGSSSSSSSSSSDTGTSSSDFGTTIDTPSFQGFQDPSAQEFIGRDSSIPFVGREEAFANRTSSSTQRSTAPTTTRRTSSTRMTSSRTSTGRAGQSSTSNGRTVRAATTTDFEFTPLNAGHQMTAFQTRLTRLPNLRIVPEQLDIKIAETPAGSQATISGAVSSEKERKLMEQLLLLEPGIDKVKNDLKVEN